MGFVSQWEARRASTGTLALTRRPFKVLGMAGWPAPRGALGHGRCGHARGMEEEHPVSDGREFAQAAGAT